MAEKGFRPSLAFSTLHFLSAPKKLFLAISRPSFLSRRFSPQKGGEAEVNSAFGADERAKASKTKDAAHFFISEASNGSKF